MSYEFRFGNGVYGKKLQRGNRVVIFFITSDGEEAIIDDLITQQQPKVFTSPLY